MDVVIWLAHSVNNCCVGGWRDGWIMSAGSTETELDSSFCNHSSALHILYLVEPCQQKVPWNFALFTFGLPVSRTTHGATAGAQQMSEPSLNKEFSE